MYRIINSVYCRPLIFITIFIAIATEAGCLKPELNTSNKYLIEVKNSQQLLNAVRRANKQSDTTIFVNSGTYKLSQPLNITGDRISIIGDKDEEKVVLKGDGMTGDLTHIFHIQSDNITIANLTMGWVRRHAIQIHGEKDTNHTRLHNLYILDTGEQMIKITGDRKGKKQAKNGIIEWCQFEFTKGIASQYYTGGVDAHYAKNWVIRNNIFTGIRSPEHRLAEYAIHFWSGSENTLVEKNRIYNVDRGIGFGFPTTDKKSPGGHVGGIIRNNMIHTNRDVGIGLERSLNTHVYHNSLFTENYFNSIEYRFPETKNVIIVNNLSNKNIKQRNKAHFLLKSHNIDNVHSDTFYDVFKGDLHLKLPFADIVDKGKFLDTLTEDFDCEKRLKDKVDIGADEINEKTPIDEQAKTYTIFEKLKFLIEDLYFNYL